MSLTLPRLALLLALPLLAACGAKPKAEEPPPRVPGYEEVQDAEFLIPAVDSQYLLPENIKTEVAYNGPDAPGTIVVDTYTRKLYLVQDGGRAIRYGIAVGREGTSFRGNGYIGRKAEWPRWTPTANMIRTQPDSYAKFAGGLPGGLENPLGARALYLYRGGRDTMFRIHGTIDPASIGRATSAGCIRLFNQDALDLYGRVESGAQVKVRTEDESIALEGQHMDDAYGRVTLFTPENVEKKEADLARIAERELNAEQERLRAEEAALLAAEKAEVKRLRACKRQGLSPENCPALPAAEGV